MNKIIRISMSLLLALTVVACQGFKLDEVLGNGKDEEAESGPEEVAQPDLDAVTAVAGLKQALIVASKNSVARASKKDGFYSNKQIHIPIPEQLESVASALRKVGFDEQIEQFELGMNRAAEHASAEASGVFMDAISKMRVKDAFAILDGNDSAATRYFRNATQTDLRKKFQPIVASNMEKINFYPEYENLLATYEKIPFTQKPDLDIEQYVTEETLDGLFRLMAQEEARIRNNPAARTTELLQQVFGN